MKTINWGVITIKGLRLKGAKKNRRESLTLRTAEHRPGYTIYRYMKF